MRGDERELEAAGEEAERQKTIAAMVESLLQRALQRQGRRFPHRIREVASPVEENAERRRQQYDERERQQRCGQARKL
jgi:hypothetical protein